MKKQILKSNSSFVAIGESPSWKTYPEDGRLFTLVQGCNINFNIERQSLKQLGSKKYIVDHVSKSPNVDLSFDYYFSPYLHNELCMGFNVFDEIDRPVFANMHDQNYNFYMFINDEDTADALNEIKLDNPNNIDYSNFSLMSFGDCYLSKYSLSFSLGEVPVVSTSFKSSNVKYESSIVETVGSATYYEVDTPSKHPLKNNNAYLDVSKLYYQLSCGYINGDIEGRTEYNPPVVVPHNSQFILQNLQVGFVPLSAGSQPLLQTFSIDIDFPRVDLYGLGVNQPYDRKLQYPIIAQISLSSMVSGFNVGFLNEIENNETGYDMDISFSSEKANATGWYKFKNAKLNNFNYSMAVNDVMNFSASFSVEINDEEGFFAHRRYRKITTFADRLCLWNNTFISWNQQNAPNPCECVGSFFWRFDSVGTPSSPQTLINLSVTTSDNSSINIIWDDGTSTLATSNQKIPKTYIN
jgi:hypothetical protein